MILEGIEKMFAGHLEIRKGYYYAVLSYLDKQGERHRPWIATGLPAKGNKRRAEAELTRIRNTYKPPVVVKELSSDMLFADYLTQWLEIAKTRLKIATYSSYSGLIKSTIAPYFRKKNVTLRNLEARQIQNFYTERLKMVSANTVIHYHAVIYSALKYAMKMDMIPQNPAAKVDCPKKGQYQPTFLNEQELEQLFAATKGTKFELPVLMGAFYGLRRGEVLGLRWDAIDFERNTITISHTVTSVNLNGHIQEIEQDSAKTKASLRTMPLVGNFKTYFQQVKEAQEVNKKVCGNCYNHKYDGYVFVDELGELMRPHYLTTEFPKFVERHGLRKMRFHDLRHSCASLLLANGVSMKQIQEWLGHSDFSTTANIYAHLDYRSKISSAEAMEQRLPLPKEGDFTSKWVGQKDIQSAQIAQ